MTLEGGHTAEAPAHRAAVLDYAAAGAGIEDLGCDRGSFFLASLNKLIN